MKVDVILRGSDVTETVLFDDLKVEFVLAEEVATAKEAEGVALLTET